MPLFTPYFLPYRVLFEQGMLVSTGQDVKVRVTLASDVTSETVDALDAIILPFVLLATSGAMAGKDIAPWTSTIENKSTPHVTKNTIIWALTSCLLDERSLVILSQMLLSVHEKCAIHEVMFSRSNGPQSIQPLIVDPSNDDPYPEIWGGCEFSYDLDEEIGRDVNVVVVFSKAIPKESQVKVEAELFSWASGLVSGAYGVAPILPSECVGFPDNETIFLDNELEWHISRVLAHPAAFNGLVNVFASLSHRIATIQKLIIE